MKRSETENEKIIIVSQGEKTSGIVGMVNCLKQEPGGTNIR